MLLNTENKRFRLTRTIFLLLTLSVLKFTNGINTLQSDSIDTYRLPNQSAIDKLELQKIKWNHPLLGVFFALLSLATVFGNCLIICAVFREQCLQTATNYYIISLAVADLLVGFIVMPFNGLNEMTHGYWFFGDFWCDIWHSLDVFASTASILSLLVIALDRHSALSDPIKYHTCYIKRYWALHIAGIWICSACISFPAIAYWRLVTVYQRNQCVFTDDIYYLIFSSLVSFYIPLTVMIIVYIRIYHTAARQVSALRTGQKINVNGSDGTQLTLRIHRGGYRGINTEESVDSTIRLPPSANRLHNTKSAALKRLKQQVETEEKKHLLQEQLHRKVVKSTTNGSLLLTQSKKKQHKMEFNGTINKIHTREVIKQIVKRPSLSALNLFHQHLSNIVSTDNKKQLNSSSAKRRQSVRTPLKTSNLNRVEQTRQLIEDSHRLNHPLSKTKSNRMEHLSLLYYPSLSKEFHLIENPISGSSNNQIITSDRKRYSYKEQFRRSMRFTELSSNEILQLSFSCGELNNSVNDSANVDAAGCVSRHSNSNATIDIHKVTTDSGNYLSMDESEQVKSESFYKKHYEDHHKIRPTSESKLKKFFERNCKCAGGHRFDYLVGCWNKESGLNSKECYPVSLTGPAKPRRKLRLFYKEQKAARTLGIVMGVFIFCWLPFFMLNVLTSVFNTNLPYHSIIFTIVTWLGYFNSCCNPIIYAFSSKDFKRAFYKILCPRLHKRSNAQLARATFSTLYKASMAESNGSVSLLKPSESSFSELKSCQICRVYEERYLNAMTGHVKSRNTGRNNLNSQISVQQPLQKSHHSIEKNSPNLNKSTSITHPVPKSSSRILIRESSMMEKSCSLADFNLKRTNSKSNSILSLSRNIRRRLMIVLNRRKNTNAGFVSKPSAKERRTSQRPVTITIGKKYKFAQKVQV